MGLQTVVAAWRTVPSSPISRSLAGDRLKNGKQSPIAEPFRRAGRARRLRSDSE